MTSLSNTARVLTDEIQAHLPDDMDAEMMDRVRDGEIIFIRPLGIRVKVEGARPARDSSVRIHIQRAGCKDRVVGGDLGDIAESIVDNEVAAELAIDRNVDRATETILDPEPNARYRL